MDKLKLHSAAFPEGALELSATQLPLTIGRSSTADIKINDDLLSRKHSELGYEGDGFRIRDLDSTNLTIVNEKDIETHTLSSGDLILLGDTEIRVEINRSHDDPNESTTRDLTMLPPSDGG